MVSKFEINNTDTALFLKGELNSSHPIFQCSEEGRHSIIASRCSATTTQAWFRIHQNTQNPKPVMRDKLLQVMSENDRWSYSLIIKSMQQSMISQERIKSVFGALHSRALNLAESRLAIVFDAVSEASCSNTSTFDDFEQDSLKYLTQGDLSEEKRENALYNLLKRAFGPMQDVTYFTTSVAFRVLEAYRNEYAQQMSKKEFDQTTDKINQFLVHAASGSRKKLTINMANFLFHPDAIQFEQEPGTGKLSFSVKAHDLSELMSFIEDDDPALIYLRHFNEGAGCPALHARSDDSNNETQSVLSSITKEFLNLFADSYFNGNSIDVTIHPELSRYECAR